MIKGIIFTILVILVILILVIAYIWWDALKQPPAHALIIEKYYVCREHEILHGGIFGKGPTKKFSKSNRKTWCWRSEWEEIDRKTFKNLVKK